VSKKTYYLEGLFRGSIMKNINGLWRKKFLLIVVPFVFSAQVHANNVGVLDEIQGTVMVDRGKGIRLLIVAKLCKRGDRIVTMDASGACAQTQ